MSGPLAGKTVELHTGRGPRPCVEGDPKTDTPAAAAHIVGVLGASASRRAPRARVARGDRPCLCVFRAKPNTEMSVRHEPKWAFDIAEICTVAGACGCVLLVVLVWLCWF
jgi:hypothetical protein